MSTSRKGKLFALALAALVMVGLPIAAWLSWPHLRFWYLFEPLGLNDKGFPEYRHRATRIVMVHLPGGTFWMGAQKEYPEERNYDPHAVENEGPVHQVTLSPFLMAKYECTQDQWEAVMGSNPSWFSSCGGEYPVEQVSWEDIQKFEARTGLALPTEAQWEYACRAGSAGVFCLGSNTARLGEYCWIADKSNSGTTHPVGQKLPNDFGLHDMHGNVVEWCEDGYKEGFYSAPEGAWCNPVCTSTSKGRVSRGGFWMRDARYCRSALRGRRDPWDRYASLGFRVAAPCP